MASKLEEFISKAPPEFLGTKEFRSIVKMLNEIYSVLEAMKTDSTHYIRSSQQLHSKQLALDEEVGYFVDNTQYIMDGLGLLLKDAGSVREFSVEANTVANKAYDHVSDTYVGRQSNSFVGKRFTSYQFIDFLKEHPSLEVYHTLRDGETYVSSAKYIIDDADGFFYEYGDPNKVEIVIKKQDGNGIRINDAPPIRGKYREGPPPKYLGPNRPKNI